MTQPVPTALQAISPESKWDIAGHQVTQRQPSGIVRKFHLDTHMVETITPEPAYRSEIDVRKLPEGSPTRVLYERVKQALPDLH